MSSGCRITDSWIGLCSFLFIGGVAYAQTNAEVNAGIQFNFSTPGAKSLALGGAFVGLADDATSAYVNPAGLTILSRPEISTEFRSLGYTHIFTDRGRLAGEATGLGVDTIDGLQGGEAEDQVSGLSFFSYVFPKEKWAVAFYRHELANFKADFKSQGAFLDSRYSRLFPARSMMNLDIVNTGVSVAFSFGRKGKLRGGVGFSYYDFSIESDTIRFALPGGLAGIFNAPDFSAGNRQSSQIQTGNDTDWGILVGFLWKINEDWSVGFAYRQGPRFQFRGKLVPEIQAPPGFLELDMPAQFQVPDVYGMGVAFQPTEEITVILDYDRIEYSELTGTLTNIFGVNREQSADLLIFDVDDADELHLGFEYVLSQSKFPISLRLGSWYDPDHRIRFEGTSPDFRALFRQGNDELHFSAGFGINCRNFQVDVAFDFSEFVETVALSTVARF